MILKLSHVYRAATEKCHEPWGTIENIYMTRVSAENVRQVLAADLNWNPSYSYSTLPKEYEGKEIPEHWKVMLTPVEPPEKVSAIP